MVRSEDWLPHMAADAFDSKVKTDPWTDFEAAGLDTPSWVISQSEIAVSALKNSTRVNRSPGSTCCWSRIFRLCRTADAKAHRLRFN